MRSHVPCLARRADRQRRCRRRSARGAGFVVVRVVKAVFASNCKEAATCGNFCRPALQPKAVATRNSITQAAGPSPPGGITHFTVNTEGTFPNAGPGGIP